MCFPDRYTVDKEILREADDKLLAPELFSSPPKIPRNKTKTGLISEGCQPLSTIFHIKPLQKNHTPVVK